ncbi:ABC transporter permease [Bacillus thuringiensis]|uniref:Bacitracin ABC transporter permease n=2 Tax=Bacillus cereus group TaxID=86661 RepID=A0A9X6YTM7_BACCE|nr:MULTISPECIES: ABC transporter permease [Bacillus]EOO30350.1 bacitracin transport permease BCRB [Bacillus cereus BAG1X1-1]EOO46332.1 bacitracin transport permease BCRB [Bacillus cereus BAG1X2-1]EOO54989.1 bacitracin transport permease BCRB [Bacillus cereus BAG1X2-2]EOO57522.1 bacitracin transport permease BCRB [Bacillus cereus BAG1X2-3]EOP03266.1 bacitracin transport permease BCRB [Bacillus cereus BAG2O-1]
MLRLIKLEWKKHKLSSYFKGVAICIIAIFAAVSLMAWGIKAEGDVLFFDFTQQMVLINTFIRITFIIFSSVILSRLVIDEYKNKTMQLLFMYPLQRKMLMRAKLTIVFCFCFVSTIIATFSISLLVYFVSPMMGLIETPATIGEIISIVPTTFISAFMISGISLIPLFFGMRKKSTPTTITSAVIIGMLISSNFGPGNGQVSLFNFIAIPIVLCLLGIFISYLSYRKIDKIDVA